jgi:uncharacterized protein YecE (DUF72 family)
VGTAGWSVPRDIAGAFSAEGSGLQRYASLFNATEINSTFYRSPRAGTLDRWRVATPADFRFAVKAPRALTHEAKLIACDLRVGQFLDEIAPLGEKLGPILVQLPPSLAFEAAVAQDFFGAFRARYNGAIACEPRHASWFDDAADDLLRRSRVARVAADPVRAMGGEAPGGDRSVGYWRLHGSPRPYYSSYSDERLDALGQALEVDPDAETWCIFDNTASGAATSNGLALMHKLKGRLHRLTGAKPLSALWESLVRAPSFPVGGPGVHNLIRGGLPRVNVGALRGHAPALQRFSVASVFGFFPLASLVELTKTFLRGVQLRSVGWRPDRRRGLGLHARLYGRLFGDVRESRKVGRIQHERIVRPDRAAQRCLRIGSRGGDRRLVRSQLGVAAGEQVLIDAPGSQRGCLARRRNDCIVKAELGLEHLELAANHLHRPSISGPAEKLHCAVIRLTTTPLIECGLIRSIRPGDGKECH